MTRTTASAPAPAVHRSRHHRRRLAAFGRAAGGVVVTSLIPSGAALCGRPYGGAIARAIAVYCAAGGACFCCHRPFAPGDVAGAILIVINPRAPAAATSASAVCVECWRSCSDDEVEAAATRILQAALPGGKFLDHSTSLRCRA